MLAIDTTDKICSVACSFDGEVHAIKSNPEVKNTDVILHMILSVCAHFSRSISDINKIILTIGPGSFTGARVGVMLAQTLSAAHGCKLYPITSSLAQLLPLMKLHGDGDYLSLIDARMQECYCARYKKLGNKYHLEMPDKLIDKKAAMQLEYEYRQTNFDDYKISVKCMLDFFDFLDPVAEVWPLYIRSAV